MIDQIAENFAGKKIFVTGHTGFKGSWFIKILNLLGAKVKGYALEPGNEDDLFNLINGDSISVSVIGDIMEKGRLAYEMAVFQPDFVFHFAAQSLVRVSYVQPAETFAVNAVGTANVLDAMRSIGNPCTAVFITTDKVYFNEEWCYPYRENDRLGGYDPYSASKACAELVIESYRNSYFNIADFAQHHKAVAVARAGNVIGGGDWAKDRLLPDIARALGEGKAVEVRNPESIRPWQHVLEPLFGYLTLAAKLSKDPITFSRAYNFGPAPDDSLPVEIMVQLAIGAWGDGTYRKSTAGNLLHEAKLLKLDTSKARLELNWEPVMNAEKAVKFTIDWYKAFFTRKESIDKFTENQIREFRNELLSRQKE